MTALNRRILIVDDTRAIHQDFRKILGRRDTSELGDLESELFGSERPAAVSFEVDSAYQGAEGVEMVRAAFAAGAPFALAIVDMRMPPGLDGIQTITRMWEIDPELQVVICTAFSDANWHDIIKQVGTTDRLLILKKPFDLVEVCQLALALTEKWRLARQARLRSAELAASLALAHAVQEASVDGIVMVGADGKLLTANRRFFEMWQIPESRWSEPDPKKLVTFALQSVRDPDGFARRIQQINSGSSEATAVDDIALRDGRFFERWTGPVRVDGGEVHGRLWCFRDVTERKQLETDRAVVAERMASMGRLAAGVGHEINNPLMYALGNVENLLDNLRTGTPPTREELLESLHDAHDGLSRIRVIVRDLQTLSRSDDADGDLELEKIVEQAIQIAGVEIRHRAAIVRNYEPAPAVRGNRTRLGQVMLNLLVNAAQSMPEGKSADNQIEVAIRATATHSIVDIADTGCGIAPEHLERIFDPFFTTKAIGAGIGLGLAVTREIVVRHGGTIDVESTPGRGTRMRVSLPHATGTGAGPPPPPAPTPPARRAKVLVIDDEPLVTTTLQRGLGAHHHVVVAAQARDALALIERGETFDMILCDLMMPDVSGIDVHRYLEREHPALLPRMVFMTGGAFTARAREFLRDVANEHIDKPFSTAAILELIDRRLQPDA